MILGLPSQIVPVDTPTEGLTQEAITAYRERLRAVARVRVGEHIRRRQEIRLDRQRMAAACPECMGDGGSCGTCGALAEYDGGDLP